MDTDKTRESHEEQIEPPYLQITDAQQPTFSVKLCEDESVFAGTSATCRIKLPGDEVASFHCMFNMHGGRVWVQDCHTGGATLVNGQPLTVETVLNDGDEITIGDNSIRLVLDAPNTINSVDHTNQVTQEKATQVPVEDRTDQRCAETARQPSEVAVVDEPAMTNTSETSGELPEPTESTEPAFEYSYQYQDGESEAWDSGDYSYNDASFANDESDLLRAEIELLQSELSQRDAELFHLREQDSSNGNVQPAGDSEEVIRLVNRLEELLDELKLSDTRVLSLEEFLRASDEANQAEQEERRQLENWVAEIEQRISAREAESAAELDRLQTRNKDAQQQLRRAEAQIRKMAQPSSNASSAEPVSAELHHGLRERNEEMSQQLQALNEENESLRQQLLENQRAGSNVDVKQLEQKLVQLELESSRERAQIARQRAELERARDELQKKLDSETVSDADCRFAAMRQHLRELHEADESEREEKRQRSLGGRIARLLNRVGS